MLRRYAVLLLVLLIVLGGCTQARQVDQGESPEPVPEQAQSSAGAGSPLPAASDLPYIVRTPPPEEPRMRSLTSLPPYDLSTGTEINLRWCNLASLDLGEKLNDLLCSSFDSKTVWPEDLPEGFDPARIMELGKNPGLGVRSLHERGITGKGIGIGIVDFTLVVDHVEYADRLQYYDEIEAFANAHYHGPAVSSIALGKTTGVAPEAELYFIATRFGNEHNEPDFHLVAQALERLLDLNRTLPEGSRIRVVSISRGFTPECGGYDEIMAAIDRAKEEGVLVVTTTCSREYGVGMSGLDRDPLADPDDVDSYRPGTWQAKRFFGILDIPTAVWAPMDSRCFAAPTGPEDYYFCRAGGWSWVAPYIAGTYALCCQVKPDITPEEFWLLALRTGETREVEGYGNTRKIRKIINPVKLVDLLLE